MQKIQLYIYIYIYIYVLAEGSGIAQDKNMLHYIFCIKKLSYIIFFQKSHLLHEWNGTHAGKFIWFLDQLDLLE